MACGAASPRSPCCLPCLYVKGISQCLYHPQSPPPPLHPFCQTPLWASSASWMTVSMWQSSLKWKGSRMLGFCASFTKLGFHPFHSVCQWLGLWMKAFETMPGCAVSDQWASAVVRRSLRWFGVHLKESQQPFLVTWGEKEVLKGVQLHSQTSSGWLRWRGERGERTSKQDSCGLILIWLSGSLFRWPTWLLWF